MRPTRMAASERGAIVREAVALRRLRRRSGSLDQRQFVRIDAGMIGRLVAQIPPGESTEQHGRDACNNKRRAPGSERDDQPCNDDAAEGRTERSAAIYQYRAARAFFRRQPYRIELGAGGKQRRLGGTETDAADQQRKAAGGDAGDGLKETPADGRAGDQGARSEAVDQPAAGNLQQRIAPEEGAEDDALHRRLEREFL